MEWQKASDGRPRLLTEIANVFDGFCASPVVENPYLIGSSGRIRTYNPPVNSRMLYH